MGLGKWSLGPVIQPHFYNRTKVTMSEKRRRRRKTSGDSEESEGEHVKTADDEVDSIGEHGESEYESAEDQDVEQVIKSDVDVDGAGEDLFPATERQEGDGEETPEPQANLDDDEDKKNPQYIPKR